MADLSFSLEDVYSSTMRGETKLFRPMFFGSA